ncbi:MAG TPA: DNA primase [Longimicrobiaceae bacterium]|nr:DNA primase [Longimicrobiaceae bacterium]
MSIPDELIEEVRQRADIVEIISEHTRLKRSGRTFRGPCPLHGGEGPNFSVDPGKGFYKCFVCGEGGSVFTFLQKHLGMSFPEAVRDVAARVGIEIPDPRERRDDAPDPNAPFHEVNAFAADWFRRQLREDAGRGAREYLQRRGIGEAAVERFGLGWAPEAWNALGDAARKHGITNEMLLALGLAKEPQKGGREPYDTFRGRLIFPIEDVGGRVVAFGGRVIGAVEEHVPKYLNSPESPVYHKGRMLYGLGWSRGAIRRAESALVVEGYMDYVSLAAHGVENVVAPLGTALTAEQADLIARYAPQAILLYDSDTAGLKATFRSGDELLRAGVEVLVATLPEGEDPDSLVRARGAAALQHYLKDAVDVLERKIQILERRDYFGSLKGTRQAIDALLPTVRAASDEVVRGLYVARIAERTGIPRETLEHEVAEAAGRDTRPTGAADRRQRSTGRRAEDFAQRAPKAETRPERILLLLLLRDESLLERAAMDLSPEHFTVPEFRTIFEELLHLQRDPEGRWLEAFPRELIPLVEDLRGDPEAESLNPAEEFYLESLRSILLRAYDARLEELKRESAIAPPEQAIQLLREQLEIQRKIAEQNLTGRRKSGSLRPSSS